MLTCYLAGCFLIRRQLRGYICKLWQILQRLVRRAATSCILYNRESRLSCISVSCGPIFTSSIQFLLTGSSLTVHGLQLCRVLCTLRTLHPVHITEHLLHDSTVQSRQHNYSSDIELTRLFFISIACCIDVIFCDSNAKFVSCHWPHVYFLWNEALWLPDLT
jgi:hypothetical protein